MTEFINYTNKDCLDLLDKMLIINPAKRITAEEALKHPYLESLHDDADEPVFKGELDFNFEFDPNITLDELRELILEEINYYKTTNRESLIDVKLAISEVAKKRKILKEKAQEVIDKSKQ